MKLLLLCSTLVFNLICNFTFGQQAELLNVEGKVNFISEAPLETIKASSSKLVGLLDFESEKFAFSFLVNTFEGFNSPLQKEHFNDYYLETEIYPKSTFVGHMVGRKPCSSSCKQQVIAKGVLTIHGVEKIVNIPVELDIEAEKVKASAIFLIDLKDYDIKIPLILEAKISPMIQVQVEIEHKDDDE